MLMETSRILPRSVQNQGRDEGRGLRTLTGSLDHRAGNSAIGREAAMEDIYGPISPTMSEV
jgi:hypothetical protein